MTPEQTATEPEQPVNEPIKVRSDVDKLKRLVALKHLTHEAVMLDKIEKQKKLVFDLAVQTRDGTVGDRKQTEAFPEEEGDSMGVNVGNEEHTHVVNNHYYPNPEEKTSPADEAVASIAKRAGGSLAKTLAPIALGACLPLAGGAIYALANYFLDRPDAVTTVNNPPAAGQILGIEVHHPTDDE